jgi:hypothetical protein
MRCERNKTFSSHLYSSRPPFGRRHHVRRGKKINQSLRRPLSHARRCAPGPIAERAGLAAQRARLRSSAAPSPAMALAAAAASVKTM